MSSQCTNNVDTGRPPCGLNADCEATRYKAICSCPRTHTGDPFVSCRPFTPADLCTPNPCGANAYCKPGTDNLTGEDRPVCLCNEGYRGNGVTGCVRGDCVSLRHDMCPDSRACYDSTCVGNDLHLQPVTFILSVRSLWANILWGRALLQPNS